MPRTARSALTLLVVAVLVALSAVLGTSSASAAAKAPFTDPNAVGYLGFCNAANQQVTSGSIDARPFMAKVVSSAPAPADYGAPEGRATLYAFQPIQYVDPADWSGKQLTASTAFTNSKAPMTAATAQDSALVDFSSVYPLHWDGYAELRFYYTASGQPDYSSTYPAAVVQIKGTTWKQVGGGTVNCNAGKALSDEYILGSATNAPTISRGPNGEPISGSGTAGSSSGGSGSSGGGSGSGSGANGSASNVANASNSSSSSGSSTGVIIAVVVVVVLAAGATGFVYYRRQGRSAG